MNDDKRKEMHRRRADANRRLLGVMTIEQMDRIWCFSLVKGDQEGFDRMERTFLKKRK